MSKATRAQDDRDTLLRRAARLNGGLVPVPFLGTTWRARQAAYWWRRIGAAVVALLGLGLVGGMAAGFTIGIVGDGHSALRDIGAVAYGLTAILGVRTALRKIAAAPLDDRTGAPRTFVPNGLLVLVLAPYGTGFMLTFVLAMLGKDFIGERAAREFSQPG